MTWQSHYPAFHQMEGVKILPQCDGMVNRDEWVAICSRELKGDLEGMVDAVFGRVEKRWVDAYFRRDPAADHYPKLKDCVDD